MAADTRLTKELKLFDVIAISTGAMFSSGFFLLAGLARRIDEDNFLPDWQAATDAHALREALLHHERYLTLDLRRDTPVERLIDRTVEQLDFPEGTLVALIKRDLETVTGNPDGIERLYTRYHADHIRE